MLFINNGRVMGNIILSGLLDRFTKLKFVSVESGIGWLPFLLEAIDCEYQEVGANNAKLQRKPSEYFTSNFHACFWFERRDLSHQIKTVGVDNVLFETDYPASGLSLSHRQHGQSDGRADRGGEGQGALRQCGQALQHRGLIQHGHVDSRGARDSVNMVAMTVNAPPRLSAGPAPLRTPGSVRRTSSIDVSWPGARAGTLRMIGRARDIITPLSGGAPIILAEDAFQAQLQPDRVIVSIEAEPARPALSRLIGERGGGGLRKALEAAVPEERQRSTPLYLILDDLSGTSLVSGWAWSQWDPQWLTSSRAVLKDFDLEKAFRSRAGICAGFAEGSSGLELSTDRSGTPAPDLRHPDDPEGWHRFTDQQGAVGMRRARRIDIRLDTNMGGRIVIDSAFQDSATTPAGGRAVVHEYRLSATADPQSLQLLSIEAEPRVLPFVECPNATPNLSRLLGTPLPELREKVLAELRGTAGCTHLNDALRALADVPALVSKMQH